MESFGTTCQSQTVRLLLSHTYLSFLFYFLYVFSPPINFIRKLAELISFWIIRFHLLQSFGKLLQVRSRGYVRTIALLRKVLARHLAQLCKYVVSLLPAQLLISLEIWTQSWTCQLVICLCWNQTQLAWLVSVL